jgi:peptide/nickel transport system substrate-binding protein
MKKRLFKKRLLPVAIIAVLALCLAACGSTAATPAATPTTVPTGGTMHVLLIGTQWPGLDAATDTQDAADADLLNAVYGQLFELAPGNKVIEDEASGYQFSDNFQTVTITLRKGLVFSNGDPVTAADVAWSINRDLLPKYGNIGDVNFPIKGNVTSSGKYEVIAHLTRPDSAFIDAFLGEAPNWTVDESALNSMGENAYTQMPVGAGPFKVVSNAASAELVLKANSKYWNVGYPKLAGLVFTAVGSDQSAASALEAGTDQLAELISTIPLLKSLPSQGLVVTTPPSTFNEFIALNEKTAPFNNILAREAVEYATNTSALLSSLYYGAYPAAESESAPGQQFYEQKDPYYRAYNLAEAKKLVSEIPGGITVNLSTTTNTAYWINEVQAIATMWEAAGITVHVQDNSLQQMLGITFDGSWQAIDSNWGGNINPSITMPQFFESSAAFSGVHDPSLDALFNESASTSSTAARAKIFSEINNLENQQADAVFMYSKTFFDVSTKNVVDNGGLGNNLGTIRWEYLALKS